MEKYTALENCNDDDVVELGTGLIKMKTLKDVISKCFKYNEPRQQDSLSQAMVGLFSNYLGISNSSLPQRDWFEKGVPCQILQVNRGWIKGKIKFSISVSFQADEDDQ